MRGRMSDAPSYAKPVGIPAGDEAARSARWLPRTCPGSTRRYRCGRTGWQTHALSEGSSLQKVDLREHRFSRTRRPRDAGMTAYMGLLEIGKPTAGESVWVAAASGAVGSVVGQIGPDLRVPAPSASRAGQTNADT